MNNKDFKDLDRQELAALVCTGVLYAAGIGFTFYCLSFLIYVFA